MDSIVFQKAIEKINQDQKNIKAVFVYGSLRPDDDSGMPWTKEACRGMAYQKAIVKDAQMFEVTYASVVINRPGHTVTGCVLVAEDESKFEAKLDHYDQIEGYNASDPASGLYERAVMTAHLQNGETL